MPPPDMNSWPLYKVAVQKKEGEEVQCYDIREKDVSELLPFIKRIASFENIADLAFFEVHEVLPNGSIKCLYGDINKTWPTTVPIKHASGIIRRGTKLSEVENKSPDRVYKETIEKRIAPAVKTHSELKVRNVTNEVKVA